MPHKRILLFSLLAASLYLFDSAGAQTIPGGTTITTNQIIDLMQSVAGFLLIVGTVLAGLAVLYSGVIYMLAGSDSSKVKAAKDALKAGLIGSAIIFGVGVILNMVRALARNPLEFFQ